MENFGKKKFIASFLFISRWDTHLYMSLFPAGRPYVRHTFFCSWSYSPNLSCGITRQLGIYACADEDQTSVSSAVVSSPIGQKNQTKKYFCLVLNAIETRLGQLHWYCVTWPGALPSTGRSFFRLVTPSPTCTARTSATRTSSWRISSSWILAQPA